MKQNNVIRELGGKYINLGFSLNQSSSPAEKNVKNT